MSEAPTATMLSRVDDWHTTLLRFIEAVEKEHGGHADAERVALGMLVYLASRGMLR